MPWKSTFLADVRRDGSMGRALRIIVAAGVAGVLAGCGSNTSHPRTPSSSPGTQVTSRSAGRTDIAPAGSREVMAYVNDKPLYMAELVDSLLRGPGRSYADQLVRCELVQQAMAKANMTLTKKDIEAETESILKLMVPQARTPGERKQVLERMLVQKQVPYAQWLVGVRVSASLRRLAEPRIKISDEMLQTEFGRMYGRQAVVRVIELASLAKAREALAALKTGQKFADLAWKRSIHKSATNGGLLDPMSAKTRDVPPAILQTALSLKKVGEVSDPIQVEATFFILQLDKSIEPKNVEYQDVKAKITTSLHARLLRFYQKAVLDEISRAGDVRFVNPVLRQQSPSKPSQ